MGTLLLWTVLLMHINKQAVTLCVVTPPPVALEMTG
jgi:hypothetical protein